MSVGNRLSEWATWPTGSLTADLEDGSSVGKLTLGFREEDGTFPFEIRMGGVNRGNREAVDLIVAAISPPGAVWWE
jgi:hypothetical protein